MLDVIQMNTYSHVLLSCLVLQWEAKVTQFEREFERISAAVQKDVIRFDVRHDFRVGFGYLGVKGTLLCFLGFYAVVLASVNC